MTDEERAFEAGYRYGRMHERLGMAFCFEDWKRGRKLGQRQAENRSQRKRDHGREVEKRG